jgi:hypothetical protein
MCRALCKLVRLSPFRLRHRDQWRSEFFVEGEEVFDAVAVAGEGFGPVTAIHGAVEGLMRFQSNFFCSPLASVLAFVKLISNTLPR